MQTIRAGQVIRSVNTHGIGYGVELPEMREEITKVKQKKTDNKKV